MEISLEWGATRICTRAYFICGIQDDIDKLVKCSEKRQMLFNFGKCKCLHTGPGNMGMNYEMGGTILSKTVKEKEGNNEC